MSSRNTFTVLIADRAQVIHMDFTSITSAHISADYVTVDKFHDMAGVHRAKEGLANFPADLLAGHLITSDTEAALPI